MAVDFVAGIGTGIDDAVNLAHIVGELRPGRLVDEGQGHDGFGRRRQPNQTIGHHGAPKIGIADGNGRHQTPYLQADLEPVERLPGKGVLVDDK